MPQDETPSQPPAQDVSTVITENRGEHGDTHEIEQIQMAL